MNKELSLTTEAKLSLYKKSQKSGFPVNVLEEVYRRGANMWREDFGCTKEQFAFERINSFIAGGLARELDEDLISESVDKATGRLKDACWKGYTAVGTKKKNGKTVPNCVPVKEQLDKSTPSEKTLAKKYDKTLKGIKKLVSTGEKVEKEHTSKAKTAKEIARDHLGEKPDYYKKLKSVEEAKETAEKQSKNKNDPSSRFDGTGSLLATYKKDTPGQMKESTLSVVKRVLEEKWSDSKYKSPSGGLTKAGVMAFRRENPGSKLQTAVTTKPSKLKKGSKAAKRRKSFCARMGGMKKRLTSAETARDPDSRINKALRKWNC